MKAFPTTTPWHTEEHYGMDLRDYFAAKAMQSIFNSQQDDWEINIAEKAYRMADAMMKAREQK